VHYFFHHYPRNFRSVVLRIRDIDRRILTIFVPRSITREIPSRAYLNFVSFDALHKFHQMYNGHAFVDSKGIEHKAQLEWAPYQRVELASTAPRDPLLNTIGSEPDYIAFVQGPTEDSKRATVVPAAPPTSTPLLDELRAKAQKQRQRQAERNARRNNRRGKRESAANNSSGASSNSGANNSNNLYKRTLKKNAAQGGQTPQSGGQSQAAETPAAPKKSQRRDRSKKGNNNANKPKPVQPKNNPSAVAPAPAPVVPPVPVTPKLLSRPKISLSSAEFVPKQHMTPPPAQYKNFLE
jgi:hypothetical protein